MSKFYGHSNCELSPESGLRFRNSDLVNLIQVLVYEFLEAELVGYLSKSFQYQISETGNKITKVQMQKKRKFSILIINQKRVDFFLSALHLMQFFLQCKLNLRFFLFTPLWFTTMIIQIIFFNVFSFLFCIATTPSVDGDS